MPKTHIADTTDINTAISSMSAEQRLSKTIALIVQSVKLLDSEPGLDRAAFVARKLVDAGYNVDVITSSFQHWNKEHRNTKDPLFASLPFNVVFLDEPGYKKNIDLRRIKSHHAFGVALTDYLQKNQERYDLVWVQIPPNNIAARAARFAQSADIPLIVDVNDLWPEAMKMAIDIPVLSSIAFAPFARDAACAYNAAWGVVGTSDEYAATPDRYRHHPLSNKLTVYVGSDIASFDEGVESNSDIVRPDNEVWISYAGTLGKSYDILTLIKATEKLASCTHETNIRLNILGDGPDRQMLEEQASECRNAKISFTGYVPRPVMARYLQQSNVLVNSLVERAPQSIVSKIADYLAAGSPIVNTGTSPEMIEKCERDGFGVSVSPEDPAALADVLEDLISSPEKCCEMGKQGRKIAETQFDRATSYDCIVPFVDKAIFK